jgi:hypothetical protein
MDLYELFETLAEGHGDDARAWRVGLGYLVY